MKYKKTEKLFFSGAEIGVNICRSFLIMGLILLVGLVILGSLSVEASEDEVIFSFGLVADIHYADWPDVPERPRYYTTSLESAKSAVETFNQEGVDFIVGLGDLIHESGSRATTMKWLRRLDAELSKFEGDLHYVIGNHDLVDLTREDFLASTSGAVNSANYYFDKEGFRFIVLDANYSPQWTIHKAIVEWMEDTLYEAKRLGLKAILFVHQGLDNRNDGTHVHLIQNVEEVRGIFERVGNVFAIFQGHTHAGGAWYINGIYYTGIQAMVNHPEPTFVIARVYEDGIDLEGYGGARHGWLPIF